MEQIVSPQKNEPYTVVKVRQSVKNELERIQNEIKRAENLRTRPTFSEVVDRLIQSHPPARDVAA